MTTVDRHRTVSMNFLSQQELSIFGKDLATPERHLFIQQS